MGAELTLIGRGARIPVLSCLLNQLGDFSFLFGVLEFLLLHRNLCCPELEEGQHCDVVRVQAGDEGPRVEVLSQLQPLAYPLESKVQLLRERL